MELGKNFPKIKEELPRKAIVSVINCQDVGCVYMCVCMYVQECLCVRLFIVFYGN